MKKKDPLIFILNKENLRFPGHFSDADIIPKISLLYKIKLIIRRLFQ